MSTNNFSDPPPTTPPLTHSEYSASSTTGSPAPYDLQPLALELEMGDHTYMKARTIQVQHDGLLSDGSLSEADTAPPTSAYDMQTYTTIAPSYNGYPVPSYDHPSSLPTPVSGAGSPPLDGKSSMQSYNQQRGRSQQPTPPGTAGDWAHPHMNMQQSSQAGSPMPLPHTANDMLEMHALEASHSPPEDPGPLVSEANWDWGHYSVSCTEPQTTDMSSPQLANQSMFGMPPNIAPSALVRPGMGLSPSSMPLAPPPGAHMPVMAPHQSPDPRHHHQQHHSHLAPPPMVSMGPQHHHHQYPPLPQHPPNQPPIMMDFQPLRKRPNKAGARRHQKRMQRGANSRGYRDYNNGNGDQHPLSPGGSGGDAKGGARAAQDPDECITLNDEASESDRYLFSIRNQLLDSKGKGMWEALEATYAERYGHKNRAALQMQLSRAVMRFGVWPEREDEALRKAVEEVNRRRYTDITKTMKEFGGCRAWDFSEAHIQKRLLQLGLEEYDEKEPSKRVRKALKQTGRRATAGNHNNSNNPWATPGHHAHNTGIGYNGTTLVTVTPEQEETILRHFCKPEPESPELGLMMPPADHQQQQQQQGDNNSTTERDQQGQADSARVARRACEQAFKAGNTLYTGISSKNRHPMP